MLERARAARERASVGLVTGAQMAPTSPAWPPRATAVLRARRLGRAPSDGLHGAPPVTVLAGEEAHVTVFTRAAAARAGQSARAARRRSTDRARWTPARSPRRCAAIDGPAIVCAQAGNVNTGACDPLDAIAGAVRRPARGCTSTARSACGRPPRRDRARSSIARRRARRLAGPPTRTSGSTCPTTAGWRSWPTAPRTARAMTLAAAYLRGRASTASGFDYVPESSRRARGFAVYAALRSLGPRRRGRPGRPLLRATRRGSPSCCAPAARRSSTTSCSTRCSCRSATARRT